MKKIVIAMFTVVLAVCMFVPPVSAETVGTLDYSVSVASVNLTSAGAGRFTVTIPYTGTPYSGIQFRIRMPQGGVVSSAAYNNSKVSKLDPQALNDNQPQATYIFSCYVLASNESDKLTGDLTCTVDITYSGYSEQDLTIVEIIKSTINGHRTDDYKSNKTTNIRLIPYGSDGGGETAKSTDASLSSMTLSSGTLTPAFNGSVTSYTATVANSVSSINVNATTSHPNAKVNTTGPFPLSVGQNTLTITVTAEDGVTKKDYTVTVTRQSPGDITPPVNPPVSPGTGGSSTGSNSATSGGGSLPSTGGSSISDQQIPLGDLGKPAPVLDKSGLKGYVSGYPDGTVRAVNYITRYEAAVIFYNLISNEDKALYVNGVAKFSDVEADKWYSAAVGYLVAAEILSGYPDGTFRGNNQITRAEFTTIATKFINSNQSGDISFIDVASSHWAYGYIRSAYNYGLVAGYPDGTFYPEISIARAEVFVIVNKLLGWDANSVVGAKVNFVDVTGGEWYYNDIVLAVNGKLLK